MDRILLKVHYENRKDIELYRSQQLYNFLIDLNYFFMFIDEDADIDKAVQHSYAASFGFQGQKCSAASRA